MRGGDGERADVLGLELGTDALQVIELLQRAAGGLDDHFAAGGERGEPLSLAYENRHTELVF